MLGASSSLGQDAGAQPPEPQGHVSLTDLDVCAASSIPADEPFDANLMVGAVEGSSN